MNGKIFSIEEFSIFDGPGIRMSVFLKGCPLRCMWCHNPEGQSLKNEFARSPNGCTECGACLACGEKLTGKPCLVKESIDACPKRLVREIGEDITTEELIARIEKNLAILNMNGGGVTFSGGEPLMQYEFLLTCLKRLRGKTNRAIQTSGYAEPDIFAEVLKECDYVLYDLKAMDNALHLKYTGASNENILLNFKRLVKSGVSFVPRIPLIPTVNDTVKNITETAKFLSECGAAYIEILPLNKMAGGKYRMLGREYITDFDGEKTPDPHIDIFNSYNIEVKVL